MQGTGKRFVYILRSDVEPERHYVGLTSDVDKRLDWHNHGPSGHTVEHRPWSLVVVIEFPTEAQAARFERYLYPRQERLEGGNVAGLRPQHPQGLFVPELDTTT